MAGRLRLSEATLKAASTCGSGAVARATPVESCGRFLRPRAADEKREKRSFVSYSSQRFFFLRIFSTSDAVQSDLCRQRAAVETGD